ncbi:MAG: N-acetyltransferase family protein [Pseudomonadota bacterium]
MIRDATESDAGAITRIYNHYIQNTFITFEEEVLTDRDLIDRIRGVQASGFSWLVAVENGRVVGYAYSCRWKERAAYKHTAEVSVYLAHDVTSKGWGTQLYEALFATLRKNSVHVAIGGIALPNPASVAIHEKFGMQKVAHFKQVGRKFERWQDVGYWQVQFDSDDTC